MEVENHANAIPWYVTMNKDISTGMVCFLKKASRQKKKRLVIVVSQETDKTQPPRQPLITTQQPGLNRNQLSTVMHYTLNGRAGNTTLPSNDLLLVRKLRENLLL